MSTDVPTERKDALRRAIAAIDTLQLKLAESESAQHEPIAIVGIGCRFPGGIYNTGDFWSALAEGRDCVDDSRAVERWGKRPDGEPALAAGLLDSVAEFDATLFNISPREARNMDPQQRIALEVAWSALEDAGYSPSTQMPRHAGVFVGAGTNEYIELCRRHSPSEDRRYFATGNASNVIAGRIAHSFGFTGPCITVDTACSSSLVAVAQAVQSLRLGKCDMALAGGVNMLLLEDTFLTLSQAGMLSPRGRCRSFDQEADGYLRAEGCGMVVLMRLSVAQSAGMRIQAVIRGCAVNHDGRASGLTVPNGPAQQEVMRSALTDAALDPLDIGHIEAHGTGTPLGDPIEAHAIDGVYAVGRTPENQLYVGSVKSQFGHLEAAAGIAGFIKMVLCLQHEKVPASLHFRYLNPEIRWSEVCLVPTALTAWPERGQPRVGAISAFGFSGTNAHVLVEEYPSIAEDTWSAEEGPFVLPISAHSASTLRQMATRYRDFIQQNPMLRLPDICTSAALREPNFARRQALVFQSREQLLEALERVATLQSPSREEANDPPPRLCFVFSGQGSHMEGMGRALFERYEAFASTLIACSDRFEALTGERLEPVLWGEKTALLADTRFAQPALLSYQIALLQLWADWGVRPDMVLGYSVGEFAAAYASGVIGLDDAMTLIVERAKLTGDIVHRGSMAAVFAEASVVERALNTRPVHVSIAAYNGERQTVISGNADEVAQLCAAFDRDGITATPLAVSQAFHSMLMQPAADRFAKAVSQVALREPDIPFFSTVKGCELTDELCSADYWRDHLVHPIRFAQAVRRLEEVASPLYLELGPKPVLTGLLKPLIAGNKERAVSSVPAGSSGEPQHLLPATGAIYASGREVDWSAIHRGGNGRRIQLPSYPMERKRHWVSEILQSASKPLATATLQPYMLRIPGPLDAWMYRQSLSIAAIPILEHHLVNDLVVVPGAFYVHAMQRAYSMRFPGAMTEVRDVAFSDMLSLEEGERRELCITTSSTGDNDLVEVSTGVPDSHGAVRTWTVHCRGRMTTVDSNQPQSSDVFDLSAARARCKSIVEGKAFYEALERISRIHHGDSFQWIQTLWIGDGECIAKLKRPASAAASEQMLPVGLVDTWFQLAAAASSLSQKKDASVTAVPMSIDRLVIPPSLSAQEYWCSARLVFDGERAGQTTIVSDVRMFDENGTQLVQGRGFSLRQLRSGPVPTARHARMVHTLQWQRVEPAKEPKVVTRNEVLLVNVPQRLQRDLECVVRASGRVCRWVVLGEQFREFKTDRVEVGDSVDDWARALAPHATGPADVLFFLDESLHGATAHLYRKTGRALVPFLQARAGFSSDSSGMLCVVSCSSFDEGGAGADPLLWAAQGLLRVHRLETQDSRIRCVDIGVDTAPAEAMHKLLAEMNSSDREDMVSYRGSARFALRLRPSRPPEPAAYMTTFDPSASYIVTGGLGALGLVAAEWLTLQGAKHLVLLGRTGASPAHAEALKRLQDLGASVSVRALAVENQSSLEQLFTECEVQRHAVRGVVHAAGIVEDGLLAQLSLEQMERVSVPKVAGTLALHEAAIRTSTQLDFFIAFSSIAPMIGSPGQAAYAMANAFLDGFARWRSSTGQRMLSINWGPWDQAGQAHLLASVDRSRMERFGVSGIPHDQGCDLLSLVASSPESQQIVARVDWPVLALLAFGDARPACFDELAPPVSGSQRQARNVIEELAAAPPRKRRGMIAQHLRSLLAEILGLVGPEEVSPSAGFFEMGVDSMSALEMSRCIELDLGVRLSATVAFSHVNVNDLADHVASLLPAHGPLVPFSETLPTALPLTDELNGMSVSNLAALLRAEIDG